MAGRYRGAGGFARPENALKRADELEAVGQRGAALQVLHDIITSKKHRTWSKTYESIMFKLIDLVVDMKKRNYGKEALMQYRNMCQTVNISSLEEVIKYYLKKASEKAEEAQSKAAAVTIDVADLEEDASPEDLMLSYVSVDKSKDRTDRELVTPWFRFLWEAYRSVLDILRNNPKLEGLYAMTANKAFAFCLQFKRTTEFRRLCDILRQHLTNLTIRYRDNRESTPEQLHVHLETRFEQLKVACELEMWAEAFRSVEDIQALITLAKRVPKQQLMATYYARLTQIFAVSENHLYHAYAWLKLFNFTKAHNKGMTPADLQAMASSVLLAMLSILPYDPRAASSGSGGPADELAAEQEKERILRMANILGFQVDSRRDYRSVLSRAALLNSVGAVNVLAMVPPEIRAVFELLTSDFNPLELCAKLAPLLATLQEHVTQLSAASPIKAVNLGGYVQQLKQVAVLRLLKQLSEVYSSLRISALEKLVPFMPFSEVEAVLVDAVKCDYLQVRVDHRAGVLAFGSVQLESDALRGHLSALAARLTKAAHMIAPVAAKEAAQARRSAAIQAAADTLVEANIKANARKGLIEKRKEEAELALLEAEREEERRRAAAAREAEAAEERRRREEALRREKERIERELEERELEEAKALLEAQRAKKPASGKPPLGPSGDKPLSKQAIMQEAMSERVKEIQDLERRMAKMARNLDHLERARREEEAPLLQALGEARAAADAAAHAEAQAAEAARHRAQWEADVAEKHRLAPVMGDKAVFAAQIIARREEEFEALRRQRARRLAERKAQARLERAAARREAYIKQCQSYVAKRIAEIEEEEAEREAERKRVEEEERQRKLDELAAQQRKREAEVEAKLRQEKEALLASGGAPATSTSGGGGAGAGGGNKFVPPALRAKMAAGGGGGGDAPPAAAPAGGADRWSRPARDDAPAPAASRPAPAEDRWGRRDEGSAAAPAGGARFVPPAMRSSGGGAAPPAAAAPRPAEDRPAPAPAAPSSGGGGKFVPSRLRAQQNQ